MAAGFPVKDTFANGDVYSASDVNDLAGTVNLIKPTAKGDLFAGSAANTYTKLSVGANDTALIADSTTATGLKWAAVPSGSMTSLSTGTLSGSSVSISSISGSYKNLYLVLNNPYMSSAVNINLRLNGDSGSNYKGITYEIASSSLYDAPTASSVILYNMAPTTSTAYWTYTVTLENYASSTGYTNIDTRGTQGTGAIRGAYSWNNAAAITSMSLSVASGTFSGGTYTLYGVK